MDQFVDRRGFIRLGTLSFSALAMGDLLRARAGAQTAAPAAAAGAAAAGAAPAAGAAKAKAVIQLWMSGGPTQTDTFDPKPEAGADYAGPLKAIATKVPGTRIGELLPRLAQQADKFTLLRSVTHGNNGHETATYIVQTGTVPNGDLVYPAMGSVVSLKKGYEAGYKGALPPYITLTSPLGRFSEAGFLGAEYQTFATGGDPNAREFTVQGLQLPHGVTPERMADRRKLLEALDALKTVADTDPALRGLDAYQAKAYEMVVGEASRACDLSQEKAELRDRYGRNHFGQSCLMARRLVEAGVPYVCVNYGGWDTHRDNFPAMKNLLPPLDGGFSALLEDLAQRGLLDSTIVEWCGEFGRTPKVAIEPPWEGGRHHFGQVFSVVVAGGGFKGGAVVGASDARGERVADRPIYPWDLAASIYRLLGIDPLDRLPHPQGCVAFVTPLANGSVPSGGILKEIL